jgi:hypothetical protein
MTLARCLIETQATVRREASARMGSRPLKYTDRSMDLEILLRIYLEGNDHKYEKNEIQNDKSSFTHKSKISATTQIVLNSKVQP